MKMTKKLSDLTLEELYVEKNRRKSIAIGFGIILIIAVIVSIFVIAKSKNIALIAIPISSWITIIPIVIQLGQVDKEIKLRNNT